MAHQTSSSSGPDEAPPIRSGDRAELDLLRLVTVLVKHKRLIVGMPILAVALGLLVLLCVPKKFTAAIKLMPPQQTQSTAVAILGQFGLSGQLAQATLGMKNPSDVFVAMLKSRTVLDALVHRFDLRIAYDEKYMVDARKKLALRTTISASREGVITVEVDDEDPKRAAEMATGYVEELEKVTLSLAVTEASQRRLFFEKQLTKVKENLANAEGSLKLFKERSKFLVPDGQAQLTMQAAAGLRAQITAREVQLASMRAFATESNPETLRLQRELAGLRLQLGKMENEASLGKGDVLMSLGQAPEATMEFIQRVREVKYNEALFELLSKQYELARIDEAQNATLIQVLDKAEIPERSSKPKRGVILTVILFAALVVSVLWAVAAEYLQGTSGARQYWRRIWRSSQS